MPAVPSGALRLRLNFKQKPNTLTPGPKPTVEALGSILGHQVRSAQVKEECDQAVEQAKTRIQAWDPALREFG